MNNDFISREALKKEIASYDREFAPDWVLNRIDNAPTVPSWEQGYEAGLAQGKQDRPQGEWVCIVKGNLGINMYACSLCGHRITCTEVAMKQHKGCYCGAQMKGGAE